MENIAVKWELHFSRIPYIIIKLDWETEPRVPNPSPEELAGCPPRFRCYACLQVMGKKRHFGGVVLNQRICRECYPYLDEWDVGAIIKFDLRHGFPVPSY